MAKAVFCIASTEFLAEAIVNELKVAGFLDKDISVLLPDKIGTKARERQSPKSGSAPSKAESQPSYGGALGWLTGIEFFTLPGAGALIAAGPILSALKGAAAGAAMGGISDMLIGMGLPEQEASSYEQKVRNGDILISVLSEDVEESTRANSIFRQAGAQQIAVTAEAELYPKPPDVRAEKWEQW